MQDRRHVTGIGEPLPEGENVLWEGRPALRSLITHVLGARYILLYFIVLGAAALLLTLTGQGAAAHFIVLGAMAVVLQLLLVWFGRLITRGTTYAITSERVVIRKGIALPSVLNIPFTRIAGISWKQHRDGSGDIAIQMAGGRLPYWLLWPHARPWRLLRAQPSMRALTDVAEAAETLRTAFLAFQEAGGTVSWQHGKAQFQMRDELDEETAEPVTASSGAEVGG